jgi:hypothetical protein
VVKTEEAPTPVKPITGKKVNNISDGLKDLVVPIEDLIPDPNNARLHPERNMEAIVASLATYGQVKPLVVRKSNNTVIAGNGTLEAAKQLGWTKIAATYVDMNDAEAAGYGLADNRASEFAKWDFEIVAKLDRLLQESGHAMIGWSQDELEVLRMADWTPPESTDDESFESEKNGQLTVTFNEGQFVIITSAADVLQHLMSDDPMDLSTALAVICEMWLEYKEKEIDSNTPME